MKFTKAILMLFLLSTFSCLTHMNSVESLTKHKNQRNRNNSHTHRKQNKKAKRKTTFGEENCTELIEGIEYRINEMIELKAKPDDKKFDEPSEISQNFSTENAPSYTIKEFLGKLSVNTDTDCSTLVLTFIYTKDFIVDNKILPNYKNIYM